MKRLAPWLRLAVTIALVVWVLSSVDLAAVGATLRDVSVPVLAVALVVAIADRALMVAKWVPLARVQLPDLHLWPATRIYMASTFAGLFMPSVAADVLRGVALGRGSKRVPEIGASIFVERMLGMLGGAVLSGVAIALVLEHDIDRSGVLPWAVIATLVPPAIWIGSFAALRLPSLSLFPGAGLVRRFGRAYELYRGRPGIVAAVWLLSAVEQTLPIWIYVLLARSLGGSIEPHMLWVATPLMLFAARLPFTLWGLGVAEGGIVYLLGLYGVPGSEALALVLVGRLVELAAILPGGLLWSDLVRTRKLE